MRKFNYILNDLAFDTLVIKCLYGEPTDEDVKECENQIKLLQQENNQLKAKLEMYENGVYYSSENDKLKEVIEEVKEYINNENYKDENICVVNGIEILQILDKAKENK